MLYYYSLVLTDAVAALFPAVKICLSHQQQGVTLPVVFISNYSINTQAAFGGAVALEVYTEITPMFR